MDGLINIWQVFDKYLTYLIMTWLDLINIWLFPSLSEANWSHSEASISWHFSQYLNILQSTWTSQNFTSHYYSIKILQETLFIICWTKNWHSFVFPSFHLLCDIDLNQKKKNISRDVLLSVVLNSQSITQLSWSHPSESFWDILNDTISNYSCSCVCVSKQPGVILTQ